MLSANYILAGLSGDLTASYEGPCMHEVLFDDRFLAETEVTTLDFAKAMIDQGVHPMTMYFPLVVHGALLMEPTETESRASLDQYIGMVKSLARRAIEGEVDFFKEAPRLAPRRRLDETAAARNPVLRWRPGDQVAAEQAGHIGHFRAQALAGDDFLLRAGRQIGERNYALFH